MLERFVAYGAARKLKNISVRTVYHFPQARAHLTDIEKKIIEMLMRNSTGLTKPELLTKMSVPLESLEGSLSRLTSQRIIIHDLEEFRAASWMCGSWRGQGCLGA